MKKKHLVTAFIVFCVAAITLLSLWRAGTFGVPYELSPEVVRELDQNGIYVEAQVDPEGGVLPGDILHMNLEIIFDPDRIKVDANQIVEEYLVTQQNLSRLCEEYDSADFTESEIKGYTRFEIISTFQCWVIEEQEHTISIEVPFLTQDDLDSSSASRLTVHKKVSFATIPVTHKPRPLVESVPIRGGWGVFILGGGALFFISGLFLFGVMLHSAKKQSQKGQEPTFEDYLSRIIGELTVLVGRKEYHVAADKLYHLCLLFELEKGSNETVLQVKETLRKILHSQKVKKKELVACLEKFKVLAGSGGDAK